MPLTKTSRHLRCLTIGLEETSLVERGAYTAEIDRVSESDWSEMMESFEDANIYQTWSYGAVRWGKSNLSHLVLKRHGEAVGIAQLRIARPGNFKLGIAYLRWGPLCHLRGGDLQPEVVRAMAIALREEYVSKRGLYLEILPNAFSGSSRTEIFHSAFARFDCKLGVGVEQYRTFILDLSPSLEELRRKLNPKWRNKLCGAERNDLNIVEGDGIDEYCAFSQIYAEMWARKKFETSVSIEDFGHIQEHLPRNQRMKVLVCEHKNQPVAGLVCSAMGNSAIYLLGATNETGMKLKASYLLQWTVIRYLKDNGTRYYDLGGIDPAANPGVHHFKNGLSGLDQSHMRPLVACDSRLSIATVRTAQVVHYHLRKLRQKLARR